LKIVMLETRQGSPDGQGGRTYEKGETYNLVGTRPEDLANVFLSKGFAVTPEEAKKRAKAAAKANKPQTAAEKKAAEEAAKKAAG
jgi:hypothetical protein